MQKSKHSRYVQQQPSDRFKDIEELYDKEENIIENEVELELNEEIDEFQIPQTKNLIHKELDVDEFLSNTIIDEEDDSSTKEDTQPTEYSEWLKEIRMK